MAQPTGTADDLPSDQEDSRRPVLDISSIIPEAVPLEDEAYFLLDGQRYQYAKVTAFSLRERRLYAARMERAVALEGIVEPTEADEQEYHSLLVALARQLAPALSEEQTARLDEGQL